MLPLYSINAMARYGVILLLGLVVGVVLAADSDGSLCNFDGDNRMYNTTDLLLCMNEQARNILFQRRTNPNRITDRAYQETRQSFPAHPFAPAYSPTPSNYFGNELLSQLLSGGFKLPNLSNLLNFSGFMKPGFKLFDALSSIAQYDDLKCVPRILCEVASGSMPGSLSYRQSSDFENFSFNGFTGGNALFGLLTAFDTSGTSPILSFGRAALLGYTNRGQPHTCYREYARCPRDSGQLIAYLNNHNGGFFRFFKGNGGAYYPQQQYGQHYGYRPQNYYKNSDESQFKILQKPQYSSTRIFSEADVEQGGSGYQFGNTNYYQESNKPDFFTINTRESGSSSIVFPKERKDDDRYASNYLNRPINPYNGYQGFYFQKEPVRKDRKFSPQTDDNFDSHPIALNQINDNRKPNFKFFPTADDKYNSYPITSSQIDDKRRPRFEQFENKVNLVRFPSDTDEGDKLESPFLFANNKRNQ